jgi:hypothetical protein
MRGDFQVDGRQWRGGWWFNEQKPNPLAGPRSTSLARDIGAELTVRHQGLEGLSDRAFLPVEGVENLPQFVPAPIDLVTEKQGKPGGDHQGQHWDIFVHGEFLLAGDVTP